MKAQGLEPEVPVTRSDQDAAAVSGEDDLRAQARERLRAVALRNALRKRAAGVPTYKVPEAAALLSLSHEHLYRPIHADVFPAVRMGSGGSQGRFVVPAAAVDFILERAARGGGCLDIAELAAEWQAGVHGGVA